MRPSSQTVGGIIFVRLSIVTMLCCLIDQVTARFSSNTINSCTRIAFGGNKDGGYRYSSSMKLDNVRIYNRTLDRSEIQTLYSNNQ